MMLTVIRILAFLAMALGFALAAKWKIGEIEEKRQAKIVTIRSEFEANGKPVVAYELDEGPLYEYEKLTANPDSKKSLKAWLTPGLKNKVRLGQVLRSSDKTKRFVVSRLSSSPDLLTGLYELSLRAEKNEDLTQEAYVLFLPVSQTKNYLRLPKSAVVDRKADLVTIWVLRGQSVEKLEVKVSRESQDFYQVVDQLKLGDLVVLEGKNQISSEDKIRVVKTLTAQSQMIAKK